MTTRGPACQELLNTFLVAELIRYRRTEAPELGAMEFALAGGVDGAKRRAEDRLTGVLAAAKAAKSKPLGTEDGWTATSGPDA